MDYSYRPDYTTRGGRGYRGRRPYRGDGSSNRGGHRSQHPSSSTDYRSTTHSCAGCGELEKRIHALEKIVEAHNLTEQNADAGADAAGTLHHSHASMSLPTSRKAKEDMLRTIVDELYPRPATTRQSYTFTAGSMDCSESETAVKEGQDLLRGEAASTVFSHLQPAEHDDCHRCGPGNGCGQARNSFVAPPPTPVLPGNAMPFPPMLHSSPPSMPAPGVDFGNAIPSSTATFLSAAYPNPADYYGISDNGVPPPPPPQPMSPLHHERTESNLFGYGAGGPLIDDSTMGGMGEPGPSTTADPGLVGDSADINQVYLESQRRVHLSRPQSQRQSFNLERDYSQGLSQINPNTPTTGADTSISTAEARSADGFPALSGQTDSDPFSLENIIRRNNQAQHRHGRERSNRFLTMSTASTSAYTGTDASMSDSASMSAAQKRREVQQMERERQQKLRQEKLRQEQEAEALLEKRRRAALYR